MYPGESKNRLDYYAEFFSLKKIRFEITPSYFGNAITINVNSDELYLVSSHSCRFIFDFYLKEFVASKIYDEYPILDAICAGEILAQLSEMISSTNINNNVFYILKQKQSFNPSSYVLFNMKSIMTCIYKLTDDLCHKYISDIEKKYLVSALKSGIDFEENNNVIADVEFSFLADKILDNENNKD